MKTLKKIWLSLMWLTIVLGISFSLAWLNPHDPWSFRNLDHGSDAPSVNGEDVNDNGAINQWSYAISNNLSGTIEPNEYNDYKTSFEDTMTLIQTTINRLLWALAVIALVYMLYCWFLIFTSGSDDKNASKGKKWISTAAIAIAWIGLSWLIISAIIWLINNVAAS